MNGYKLSTPRAALGLIAVAMAAITMSVFVVLPANLDHDGADPYMLAAAQAATWAPNDGASSPARTDAPELLDHEEHIRAGRMPLAAQELRRRRHKPISRSGTHT